MNPQLFEAFTSRLHLGYSYEQIEKDFLVAGYSRDEIKSMYTEVQSSMAVVTPNQTPDASVLGEVSTNEPSAEPQQKTDMAMKVFLIVVPVVLVGVMISVYLVLKS